jgi:peptidyl-prolyl cis-trans isomerase NIMA-interacting 1
MRAHDDEAAGADGRPAWSLTMLPARGRGAAGRAPCSLPSERLALPAAVLAAALPFLLACTELTTPPGHRRSVTEAAAVPAATPAPPETAVVAEKAPPAPQPADQIEASHILVSYQGATRAKPTVTRTRDEARELATQLAARAREPGVDFAQLAKDSSDGPSGVEGGALPRFGRQQMVKPFSDAAFALRPGEISGVVETNFGFHVIRRNP